MKLIFTARLFLCLLFSLTAFVSCGYEDDQALFIQLEREYLRVLSERPDDGQCSTLRAVNIPAHLILFFLSFSFSHICRAIFNRSSQPMHM